MFKRLLSSPLGIAFTAAALVLTISPEARNGTRKLIVKGTAASVFGRRSSKTINHWSKKRNRTLSRRGKGRKGAIVCSRFFRNGEKRRRIHENKGQSSL